MITRALRAYPRQSRWDHRPGAGQLLALVVAVAASCSQTSPGQTAGSAIPSRADVAFITPGASPVRVAVEIVRTPQERALGLMFRQQLGARNGMLFLFERDEVQSFWMKNTYIPLDMIFIDRRQVVVGVLQNVPPRTLNARSVGVPSRYVVEVNAGFAAAHGIRVGTRVELPH